MGQSWTGRFARVVTGLFVPATCAGCGGSVSREREGALCLRCLQRTTRAVSPWCSLCGLPTPDALYGAQDGCVRSCGERHFARARAFGVFEGHLKDLIGRFKYGREQALAEPLGRALLEAAQEHLTLPDYEAVVPVPLHPERLRDRGFNQAFLLARPLAREVRIPVVHALKRDVLAPPQVGSGGAARVSNIAGVFSLAPRAGEQIGRRNVLLIDDVLTTGATAAEAARVLLRGGALRVDVMTVARAL